ncbi:MAG: hypothetical protein AAGI37_04560 [Planctomycetota bacterium]
MPAKQKIPWWIIPTVFYIIHFVAVLLFAASNVPISGPNADAGSMVWIAWILIDFPIGIIATSITSTFSSNTLGVLSIAIIGGIQWIIWGLCLTAIIRSIQNKTSG